MSHLKAHHTTQHNNQQWKTCTIQINGVDIQAEPDSGSNSNIMDESQFKKLQKHAPEMKLRDTKIKLKALTELPVLGAADVEMSNETRTVRTTIIVIKGKIDSPPLIGRQTIDALGMPLIDATSGLKSPNKIKTVKQRESTKPHNEAKTELDTIY